MARAERWGAILLLDEADVYIRTRGDDLTQNAIVGVFLRVLEYYRGVMFMTTNRPDMVDDAIASRCVARIHYEVPTPERQAAIWAVQAKMNQIEFPDKEIRAVVKEYPHLSGRDVKNLMKLALLVTEANGEARITAKTIHVVKRFKSTNDLNKEPVINARS
jgi:AAA+ superfamily predicted ATPase